MRGRIGAIVLGVLLVVATSGFQVKPAVAALDRCLVSSSPHVVNSGSVATIGYHLEANGGSDIRWLQIIRPDAGYLFTDSAAPGWTVNFAGSTAVLSGGTVSSGATYDFTLDIQTANPGTPPGSWTVLASDEPSGTAPLACTGDTTIQLSGPPPPDNQPPTLTNLVLSKLTPTSVVISYLTNEPAISQIEYGTSSSYGSTTDYETSYAFQHQRTLTGLTPNTGYHFQVDFEDETSNGDITPDNTFLTPKIPVGVSPVPDNNSANAATLLPGSSPTTPLKPADQREKVPPTIGWESQLSAPLPKAPILSGTAEDNVGIAQVQYSTDGGLNWVGATEIKGIGTKKATFSFTPIITEDGNYIVKAQAMDTSGNLAVSLPLTLVIDTGPPIIGGVFFSVGPQSLVAENGVTRAIASLDQTITLNAIGGPTSVTLVATQQGGKRASHNFTMAQSPTNGLWAGLASFAEAGQYTLVANAVDGAANTSSRNLGDIKVTPSGWVHGPDGQALSGATVTVYSLDSETGHWAIWDGAPFGQVNPQVTTKSGQYESFLPSGQYFTQITGPGYRTVRSPIFSLPTPTPVGSGVTLKKNWGFRAGRVGLWLPGYKTEASLVPAENQPEVAATTRPLPRFSLPSTNGQTVTDVSLLGRPTVMTVMTTWAPSSAEQLAQLDRLADQSGVTSSRYLPSNRPKK